MSSGRSRLRALAIAGAACAIVAVVPGCRTPWYKQDEKADIVRTDVRVSTTPDGASVYFNGKLLGRAPLIVPVEYDHVIELWARAGNPGADMRDSLGPVGSVVLAPVWLVGSIPQRREEQRRNVYGGNIHEIRARWSQDGADDVVQQITLNGEESVEVTITR